MVIKLINYEGLAEGNRERAIVVRNIRRVLKEPKGVIRAYLMLKKLKTELGFFALMRLKA